jgi:hypothetical protein
LISRPAQADTPLEISMKGMSKAYKALAFDLQKPQDASKPDYLTLVAKLKTEGQNARGDVPKIGDAMPPDAQAKMVAAYQKSMDAYLQSVDALGQAIQQGQWPGALKQMDAIKQEMVDGHKQFRKREH